MYRSRQPLKDAAAVTRAAETAAPTPAAPDARPVTPLPAAPDTDAAAAMTVTAPAPVLAVTLSPAKPAAPAGSERPVRLNFDNAEISLVIQTIGELLHLNYIVAPSVKGRISIQTSQELPVSALLPVLEQILEVNGFMAVKSGDFYKIVPSNQAKQETVETVLPGQTASVGTGLVTKIVQLRHISPGEVVKILTPFKTAAGIYQAHEAARLLFLTEVPAKTADLLKIVEVLDVDSFASIQVELYPVRYASVEDLAKELNQIVTQVFAAAGRGRTLFRILPVPQVNAIMVFSGEPGLAANIREWIAKLDLPASEANERIFVYPLSHATAETLAAVIEKVFRREPTKTPAKSAAPVSGQPLNRSAGAAGQGAAAVAPAAPQATAATGDGSAASGAAAVTIVADKDTNMLIVQTASWFYPTVEEMIRKLDAMPKQVLIEVLIAEVTLDDSNQFGIQWALKGSGTTNILGESHSLSSTTQNITSGIGTDSTGFTFMVTEANRLSAAINAYAKDKKVNILSAPHILATNNKESKIEISDEIPIFKGSTTTDGGSTTNDIEYRSVGTILTVTPHVNEGGFVTLDLQQEVSDLSEDSFGDTKSASFSKRSAKTTMVVRDDQTLVVGGIIKEYRTNDKQGIPGLSKIPLLGYLFGSTDFTYQKRELVLMITPRIINTVEEGTRLTEKIKGRVLMLKKGIGNFPTLEEKAAP